MAKASLPIRLRGCCEPTPPPLDRATARPLVKTLKALADETRVQIVSMLKRAEEPICVCDFTAVFDLSQPTISHHMTKLREAGLVRAQRRGIWSYYSLAPELAPEVRALLETLP